LFKNPEPVVKIVEDHIALFERWTKYICNMDCEVNKNYNTIRNMFRRWGKFHADDVIGELRRAKLNNKTYNRRLSTLLKFYNWAVKCGYLSNNPLEGVQRKRIQISPEGRTFSYSLE
jgi:site-specific recombinase XerD